jgi:hypothetical protein
MRAVVIAVTLACVSCKRAPTPEQNAAAVAAVPSATPVDHLAPGELVEGPEKLFALPVPRLMKVSFLFKDRGLAEGRLEPEQVANYVRARVRDGKITTGASNTVFEGVRHPAEPLRLLRVRIERARGQCQLEVLDITPAAPEPDPGSDEARWRKAGFNPGGKPLDPMHMQ